MHPPQPLRFEPHRRLHLIGWTLATLLWLAVACLDAAGFDNPALRRQRDKSFKQIARQTTRLIFLRAAELLGRHRYDRTQQGYGAKRRRQQLLRALVGVALRRALRHRDPLTRVALLIEAFNRIDTRARALVRRLRNGLTRAWGAAPTPEPAEALVTLCARPLISADTS